MPDIMTTLGGWVSEPRKQMLNDYMPVLQALSMAQQSAQRRQDEDKSWNAVGEYARQMGMDKEFQSYNADRTRFTPEAAAQSIQRAAEARYKNAQATYAGVNPESRTPISLAPQNLAQGTPEFNAYQDQQISLQQARAKSDAEMSDYYQKLQMGAQVDIAKEQALAPIREQAQIVREQRALGNSKNLAAFQAGLKDSQPSPANLKEEAELSEYRAAESSLKDAASALGIKYEDFIKSPKQYYRQLKLRGIPIAGVEKDLSTYRKYAEKIKVGTLQQIDWTKLGATLQGLK